MSVQSAVLLTVALLLATAVDEVLIFGVAPRLFTSGPAAGAAAAASAASVRDAEAAERRACWTIEHLDLWGPRTSCQAR